MTQTYFVIFLVNKILVKLFRENITVEVEVSRSISNYWHLWIYDYPPNKNPFIVV